MAPQLESHPPRERHVQALNDRNSIGMYGSYVYAEQRPAVRSSQLRPAATPMRNHS
jgi:hypothetical protein